jgi:hypothetical protein
MNRTGKNAKPISLNQMITRSIFLYSCFYYCYYTILVRIIQPLHHHQSLGILVVLGMKHTFYIDHTKHTLIGPIGKPFGYNSKGYYKLIVSNFQLQMKYNNKKTNKNSKINQQQQLASSMSMWDDYEAGFFLQRYSNLASFHQHYNQLILANTNTNNNGTVTPITQQCSFAHFLASNDNDDTYNNNKKRKRKEYRRTMTDTGTTDTTDNADNTDDFMDFNKDNNNYDDTTNENDNIDDDFYSTGSNGNNEPNDSTMEDLYPNYEYETRKNSKNTFYYDDEYVNDDIPSNKNNNNNNNNKISSYSTAKDGIYLSMKSIEKTWKPNQPFVEYIFQSYVELYICIYALLFSHVFLLITIF